jgi:hypothetical protein
VGLFRVALAGIRRNSASGVTSLIVATSKISKSPPPPSSARD